MTIYYVMLDTSSGAVCNPPPRLPPKTSTINYINTYENLPAILFQNP